MTADSAGKFSLTQVPAGDYEIRAYVAHDSTLSGWMALGQYFSGRSYPYQFAEPFGVYPDEVKVRERWTTEGIEIRLH